MRTIENFLDTAHFPYVHRGLNGDPANPDPIEDYEVYEDETGLRTSEITVNQPYGDHRGIPVVAGYTFHCPRLLTAYFSKKTGPTERFCTFMTVTPVEPDACIVWLVVAINYGPELTIEQILTRQDRVFTQDRIIVESQWPVVMPLSLTEELHVRCDRLAIQYRKWARRLADENRGIPTIPVHAAALGD
jgi:phenylpropionate dioxygenase-like ring-hydroxylating dioxygenase large terminal subunit